MMKALNKMLTGTNHPWVIVLTPKRVRGQDLAVPKGSICSGRTWRTLKGKRITFATPEQSIPEGPFHLVLKGWGPPVTEEESINIQAWRRAAVG